MTALKLTVSTKKRYRRKVQTFLDAVMLITLDLKRVDADIMGFKPVRKVDTIEGDNDIAKASMILSALQKRRSKLAGMKLAVNRAHHAWAKLRQGAEEILRPMEEIASLKNEPLREAAIASVIQPLIDKTDEAAFLLEQLDTLMWEVNNNQRGIESQINLYREQAWDAKRGV